MRNDFEKVNAPIINADGNVFNLIGICSKELRRHGYSEEAKELEERVTNSKSYDDALMIMMEYVNPVDIDYNEDLDYDMKL